MTTDSMLGRQFDEYRLERLLSKGAMARLYRAVDTRLNRFVTVKVIDVPFRRNAEYVQRFEQEVQAIAQLTHPNIVPVYRYNEVNGRLYVATQYIEGASLEKLIAEHRPDEFIAPNEILKILAQLCDALEYVHQRGVVHRDLRPANLILDGAGRLFLTEFGLPFLMELGTLDEVVGPPRYIAPEQINSSRGAVPQSDYYAVGVMLYEMLTGQPPFDAKNPVDLAMMHISEPPRPLCQLRPDLSPAVEEIVLKLLAKEPHQRDLKGRALVTAFEGAFGASVNAQATDPGVSLASRVLLELEKNPLPPAPTAPAAPRSAQAAQPVANKYRPFVPLFAVGGALVLLVVAAALALILLSLSKNDGLLGESQPVDATAVATPTSTPQASPTPSPTLTPASTPNVVVLVRLQNGVGLTNQRPMNDGNFQVEGYCYQQGFASASHDNVNWFCRPRQGSRVQLTQEDFNKICQLTYSNPKAVAVLIKADNIPAFNWRCFGP
jgi:serine/threonine protein kinase